MLKEFKEFAMRGNVMDMAIGIIIGGAFGKIVSSFVKDIIMPIIGVITGGIDFSDMAIKIGGTAEKPVLIGYGTFITTIIDFIIIAFAIFLVVKGMNAARKKEEEAPAEPPAPPKQEVLLEEIRDLLKK